MERLSDQRQIKSELSVAFITYLHPRWQTGKGFLLHFEHLYKLWSNTLVPFLCILHSLDYSENINVFQLFIKFEGIL